MRRQGRAVRTNKGVRNPRKIREALERVICSWLTRLYIQKQETVKARKDGEISHTFCKCRTVSTTLVKAAGVCCSRSNEGAETGM
jgi:hypothetical protein